MNGCRPPAHGFSWMLGVLLLASAEAGCANYAAPLRSQPPLPASPTPVNQVLRALPPPREKVVAAVYRFRDQTGQYKMAEVGSSWSTAVTQGATSILMRALEDSGWFVTIEREGLSNLLNERQIIQSIRSQYEGPGGQKLGPLPPLLYAGVLLEGGIIGYDSNLLTGGVDARYFGAGAGGQFRQDQVTVYLRAVSTQTGRVLKTVYTTKTILSQQLEANIFRFVEVDRLLEGEIGYSFNEPAVVAVTEAIEEAVRGLVIEGVRDSLWTLRDPADLKSPAFTSYDRALARAAALDAYGLDRTADRRGLFATVASGASQYQGNYREPFVRPSGALGLRWMPTTWQGLEVMAMVGGIGAEHAFQSTTVSLEADWLYYVLPHTRTSPFLRLGFGLMTTDVGAEPVIGEDLFPYASLGGGVERLLTPSMGLALTFFNQYALVDGLDGLTTGSGHDSVWNLTLGLSLY